MKVQRGGNGRRVRKVWDKLHEQDSLAPSAFGSIPNSRHETAPVLVFPWLEERADHDRGEIKDARGGSASRIRDPACCFTSADPAAVRGNCDHF